MDFLQNFSDLLLGGLTSVVNFIIDLTLQLVTPFLRVFSSIFNGFGTILHWLNLNTYRYFYKPVSYFFDILPDGVQTVLIFVLSFYILYYGFLATYLFINFIIDIYKKYKLW